MSERAPHRLIAFVPNALSALRLVCAFGFPAAPLAWRLPIVVVGGLSDMLDGMIARRFDAGSASGALLDAIADKLMVLSVLLTLAIGGDIGWWQVALVLARDLAVGAVAAYTAVRQEWRRFRDMVPSWPGKAATLVVFAWFVALLLGALSAIEPVVFWLAAACSVTAALDYLARFVRAWVADRGRLDLE